jgi:hypothetical protein
MAFPIVLLLCEFSLWSFYLAMICIGVAWNLSFTAGAHGIASPSLLHRDAVSPTGTVLLAESYFPAERTKAQAINDLCVFGVSSCIALLSGLVFALLGWAAVLDGVLLLYCVGMAALMVVLWGHRQRTSREEAAAPDGAETGEEKG